MEFTVGRVNLKKAVNIVEKALPTKDFGDATSGILMDVKGDKLTLTANSVECFISTQILLNEAAKSDGFCVPNGNIISKIVGNLGHLKKPVDIAYDDENNELSLKCDSYNGTIAHYPPEGFITIPDVADIKSKQSMSIPARLIGEAVKKVAFARSNDQSYIQLTGVFIDQTENNINLVATDSLRFSSIQYSSKVKDPKSVVVGYKYLDLLRRLLEDLEIDGSQILKLYVCDDKIYFIHEDTNTIIGLQIYGDKFIEGYQNFIIDSDSCKNLIRVNRESFLEMLDLATSHNNSIQDEIIFEFDGKKGYFKSSESSSKLNAFDVPFDVAKKVSGEKFSVKLVPQFFYDVMNVLKDKEVTICFIGSAGS